MEVAVADKGLDKGRPAAFESDHDQHRDDDGGQTQDDAGQQPTPRPDRLDADEPQQSNGRQENRADQKGRRQQQGERRRAAAVESADEQRRRPERQHHRRRRGKAPHRIEPRPGEKQHQQRRRGRHRRGRHPATENGERPQREDRRQGGDQLEGAVGGPGQRQQQVAEGQQPGKTRRLREVRGEFEVEHAPGEDGLVPLPGSRCEEREPRNGEEHHRQKTQREIEPRVGQAPERISVQSTIGTPRVTIAVRCHHRDHTRETPERSPPCQNHLMSRSTLTHHHRRRGHPEPRRVCRP